MKPKKIVSIALLSIPLYFFIPNHAKADDFKINLNNSKVEIDKTNKDYLADDSSLTSNTSEEDNSKKYLEEYQTEADKKKEGSYFEDSDFSEFMSRANNRLNKEIKRKQWNFEISQNLAKFICNPNEAVAYMDDTEKGNYLDGITTEAKQLVSGEYRRQFRKELKNSTFYKNFKKNIKKFKKKVGESSKNQSQVIEKESYTTSEGGIKFVYKEQNYQHVENGSTIRNAVKSGYAKLIVEEKYIENLPNEKARLHLTICETEVVADKNGNFKWTTDLSLFSLHSFDYNPSLDVTIITKNRTMHLNTDYELREGKLRSILTSPLPSKCSLTMNYTRNTNTYTDNLTTTISRSIKGWSVNLSYSAQTKEVDEGTYWLKFERRF